MSGEWFWVAAIGGGVIAVLGAVELLSRWAGSSDPASSEEEDDDGGSTFPTDYEV